MAAAQALGEGWSFAEGVPGAARPPRGPWRGAEVPGNVHLDLLRHGLIPDPLVGRGEAASAWVEGRDWWYRCRFRAQPALLAAPRVRLAAEGLDTWCTLWLNGRRLGRTETMFVGHAFEVGALLKPGPNELLLRFESPARVLESLERRHGPCAAIGDPRRAHGRKAQCSFGWDWGPRLPTSGVFKPVRLEALDEVRVADAWVRTLRADARRASGTFHAEVEAVRPGLAVLELTLGDWSLRRALRLRAGSNRLGVPWTLERPRLWWPRGQGEPALTRASARLDSGAPLELEAGVRTVELRRGRDAAGESFGLRVNGRPIFAKGANWIPPDPFLGRLAPARVEDLLDRAVEANYNLLRVWGGGVFGDEGFYSGCDRRGLLVWQDFLFACSEAPEHPAFQALLAAETGAALRRLRRHPSLALLCGNNENHQARHDGWFKGRQARRWGRALYHKLLPSLCARHAPGVPYWPGSPYGGADPNSEGSGDRHHWAAWGALRDPEAYLEDRSRFVSEFGLASLPGPSSLDKAIGPGGERSVQGPELALHDKDAAVNRGGLARLSLYLHRHLPAAPGLDAFRYLSQVFQARGLSLGLEHWRRLKPHTQGALLWQHNDCWPAAPSWSLLDGDDRPKLAFFGVKASLDDVLLSAVEARLPPRRPGLPWGLGDCEVWLSLDGPRPLAGRLRVERWNMGGREAVLAELPVKAGAESSRRFWRASREACGIRDPSRQYLAAFLESSAGPRRCLLFFERPVRLALGPSAVVAGARERGGLIQVALRSRGLALACEISAPVPGRFSDNGVDLLPGETRVLDFRPDAPGPVKGAWKVLTLNQMARAARAAGNP